MRASAARSPSATIFAQLLTAFTLLVLTPSLVITVTSALSNIQTARDRKLDQLESVATLKSDEIDMRASALEAGVGMLLGGEEEAGMALSLLEGPASGEGARRSRDRLIGYFRASMAISSLFERISLIDATGRVIASTDRGQEGRELGSESIFQQGMQSRKVLPPQRESPGDRIATIVAVCPIVAGGRGTVGVLAGYGGASALEGIMEMPLGLGRTGEGYILGSDYVPLSALRFKADADFAAMRTEGARLALESKVRGYGFYRDYRGVPVIGVYGWLPALEMALIVEQDQAEVFGPAYATLARNLIVAMIAVLLATVAAYSVARGIARPLRTLSEAAARIADGDLDCRAAVGRRDEIGKLAASFNLMTGKLRDLIGQLHEELAERKRAEEELAASKRLLQDIADNSTSLIYVLDSEGRFLMVNRQLESLLGMTREALVGRPREAVLPAETAAMHEAHDLAVIAEGRPMMFEEPNVEPDGVHTYLTVKFPMIDAQGHIYGIGGISTDITERQRSEERIRKSLAEKETLLRELYHRTKNNMGVIIALLDMQSMETENEELRAAFADTQDRIRAMALVHQKLYEAKDLSHINLKEYLGDLSALLAESLGSRPGGLAIVPDLEDAFVLIDSAIPCGLIVNELISNAQKHAFPDGRPGRISIRLRRSEAGAIRLDVSDDGVGFPRGFDPKRDGRMGLKTVFALAESQLRGEIGFETGDGVSWRVLFRDDLYGTRV